MKLQRYSFDKLDMDGKFSFDLSRKDFDHKEIFEKIIAYSNLTWAEIKRQTHDNGKSKHHYLSLDTLSKLALDRIDKMNLQAYQDSIFSFALQNKLRVIGIRDEEKFHVVWYDPYHDFCPSKKK